MRTPSRALCVAAAIAFVTSACRTTEPGAQSAVKDDEVAPEVAKYKTMKPRKCAKSKAPLFKDETEAKPPRLILKSDLKTAFLSPANWKPGVVYVEGAANDTYRFIPVIIERRGNSRGDYCEFKPLRFTFLLQPADPARRAELEAAGKGDWTIGVTPQKHAEILGELAALPSVEAKVQHYHDKLAALMAGKPLPANGFPQEKGSLFHKVGDDIKLVTHCGKAQGWPEIGGPDYPAQHKRLMLEYALYKVLDEFDTAIIDTAAATFKYYGAADATPMLFDGKDEAISFFREPKTQLAERCDLKPDRDPAGPAGAGDAVSAQQGPFINYFTASLDFAIFGHNYENLFGPANAIFYSPYDFDLSGVITETYFKNPGPITAQAERFKTFLAGKENNEIVLSQVLFLLNKMPKLRAVASKYEKDIYGDAELPANGRRLTAWFDHFEPLLKAYVEKHRATTFAPYITAVETHFTTGDAPAPQPAPAQ